MFFNPKFNKKFQKEMLKNFKKAYQYDSSAKIEVTKEFERYKKGITLQGEITVTSDTIFLDSLFTPFLKHIMKIHSYNGNLIFDIVTTEYKFNEED